MTEPTPGPWFICRTAPNKTWYEGRTIGSEPTGVRICDMPALSPPEEIEANARLIAAAPDLLDLLEVAVATARAHEKNGTTPIPLGMVEEWEDGIAKAKGDA